MDQWIEIYDDQRKRNNTVVNNELELSNEKTEISTETTNEEIETQSEHSLRSNVIDVVEYVSRLKVVLHFIRTRFSSRRQSLFNSSSYFNVGSECLFRQGKFSYVGVRTPQNCVEKYPKIISRSTTINFSSRK